MDEEWRRKLQQSESKRAELVMENHRLKEQVEELRMSSTSPARASPRRGQALGRGGEGPSSMSIAGLFASPIRGGPVDEDALEEARRHIEALETELHRRTMQLAAVQQAKQGSRQPNDRDNLWGPTDDSGAARDAVGFVSIAPIPQASEEDYGFAEEDHAKQCAEEIMARLLRALHTQRDAQEKLAAAQLQNVRLQSLLDESRGREVVLSQMMGAYSDVVNSASPEGSSPSSRASIASGNARQTTRSNGTVPQQPQQVEQYLQQCMHNLSRLDGVKRRLIDEKLREVLEENAKLKQLCQHHGDNAAAGRASPAASGGRRTSNAYRFDNSATAPADVMDPQNKQQQPALLSDERTLLMALMEREKEYQSRMEQLKRLVMEKEKTVQDLRKMLQANVARINNVR